MDLTKWLKREGWEILEADKTVLKLKGTPGKLTQEADQLMVVLQDTFGFVFDPAVKNGEDGFAASIRAVYDPVTGQAIIEVTAAS